MSGLGFRVQVQSRVWDLGFRVKGGRQDPAWQMMFPESLACMWHDHTASTSLQLLSAAKKYAGPQEYVRQ